MGLLPKHHGELNKTGISAQRYAQLRVEYANNRQALQQIDVYDPATDYHNWLYKYRDALLTNDIVSITECEIWFARNYDLI